MKSTVINVIVIYVHSRVWEKFVDLFMELINISNTINVY